MKKIKVIRIRNFKFVQDEVSIKLDGLNALIHGDNGTGKSTLYWALHSFFESSLKEDDQVKKYFDPSDLEKNLINLNKLNDCQAGKDCSYIEIDFLDETGKVDTHKISNRTITVNKHAEIREVLESSDFLNYKLISGLYNCPPSEEIDLFPYFEANVFNLVKIREGEKESFLDKWKPLKKGLSKQKGANQTRYPAKNSHIYKEFQEAINKFNNDLTSFVSRFLNEANRLLKSNFAKDYKIDISIEPATYNHDNKHYTVSPKMILRAKPTNGNVTYNRPHICLNEEKLTALALSIRFAIIRQRLSGQNLKLLIVDDLLISLDMSNRMCVLSSLLDIFKDFQTIILTHDLGFFNLIKDKVDKTTWKLMGLEKQPDKLCLVEKKKPIEYAKEAFATCDYDLCGLYLRKELEEIVREFMSESDTIKRKWKPLDEKLSDIKNFIISQYTNDISKLIKNAPSTSDCDLLFTDIQSHPSLSDEEKAEYEKKQISLKKIIKKMSEKGGTSLGYIQKAKDALKRVANPAAHMRQTPLFSSEVDDAINAVIELRSVFSNPALDQVKERFRKVQKEQSSTSKAPIIDVFNTAKNSITKTIESAIKTNQTSQVVLDIMIGMLHSLTAEMLELSFDYLDEKDDKNDINWDKYLKILIRDRDWNNEEKNVIGSFIAYLLDAGISLRKRTEDKLEKKSCMPYRTENSGWYFPIITDGIKDNEATAVIDEDDVPF